MGISRIRSTTTAHLHLEQALLSRCRHSLHGAASRQRSNIRGRMDAYLRSHPDSPSLVPTFSETYGMLVRASIPQTLMFMSEQDQPEQHTLFRIGSDGRMKTRQVWKPSDQTRHRHSAMLDELYGLNIPMPRSFGGIRGKSLRDNVEPHRGNDVFYMIDIKDAYGSVDIDHLRNQTDSILQRQGRGAKLRQKVDDFIANDAVIDGVPGLPLGYPASPFLFNLYCREMDGRLSYALSNFPWSSDSPVTYTRWLDDLTFSAASGRSLGQHKRRAIRTIVQETPGFAIEHSKSRYHKLGNGAVTITGVSLYPDGRMAPSPALLEKTREMFDVAEDVLERHGGLDDGTLAEVHGYNSVLHIAGDPERSGSRVVRDLAIRYETIARRSLGMK